MRRKMKAASVVSSPSVNMVNIVTLIEIQIEIHEGNDLPRTLSAPPQCWLAGELEFGTTPTVDCAFGMDALADQGRSTNRNQKTRLSTKAKLRPLFKVKRLTDWLDFFAL